MSAATRIAVLSRETVNRIKRIGLTAVVALLLGANGVASVLAADTNPVEARYNLMAVFLYNFASFVDWPADPQLDEGPILIGVLGTNPFGAAAAAIEKKTVNGRPIKFRIFPDLSALEPTHILFVENAAAGHLTAIRRALRGHAVLTVGETADFTQQGGVVRFYEVASTDGGAVAGQSLRLEINEKQAQALNLQIRSKLLRLATVVDYSPPVVP